MWKVVSDTEGWDCRWQEGMFDLDVAGQLVKRERKKELNREDL